MYLIKNYVVKSPFRKNVSIIFCVNIRIYIIKPITELSYGASFVKFICISVVSIGLLSLNKLLERHLLHNNMYYCISK